MFPNLDKQQKTQSSRSGATLVQTLQLGQYVAHDDDIGADDIGDDDYDDDAGADDDDDDDDQASHRGHIWGMFEL